MTPTLITSPTPHIQFELSASGQLGLVTLSRPQALNALDLPMVRALAVQLKTWAADSAVLAVVVRGSQKGGNDKADAEPHFGHFCAGGDIRFFHTAALAGDAALDDFFTEEYTLNHTIAHYPKPYIALMDGVVMGGGMGISQGAASSGAAHAEGAKGLRVVTERSKLAMPETNIGLFPDVGGGYFLSRLSLRRPGLGEYLALTGHAVDAATALSIGLADTFCPAQRLHGLWQQLSTQTFADAQAVLSLIKAQSVAADPAAHDSTSVPQSAAHALPFEQIAQHFTLPSALEITRSLEASATPWSHETAAALRKRSPLMLCVTLEQLRRARSMTLAQDLRMERDLVHHCFYRRGAENSETVEGIRALAVDKDHSPKWQPTTLEAVAPEKVAAFFESPWASGVHPLESLA